MTKGRVEMNDVNWFGRIANFFIEEVDNGELFVMFVMYRNRLSHGRFWMSKRI